MSVSRPFTIVAQTRESEPLSGYMFLLDSGLTTADLVKAVAVARQWDVPLPEALCACGLIGEAGYAEAVGRALGLPVDTQAQFEVVPEPALAKAGRYPVRRIAGRTAAGEPVYAVAATGVPLPTLRRLTAALARLGCSICIVRPSALEAAIERADRPRVLRHAITALVRSRPEFSAARGLARWQQFAVLGVVGLFIGGWLVAPGATVVALLALLTGPFIGVVAVRLVAVAALLRPQQRLTAAALPDAGLPAYSVLVPLFDEAAVIGDLVASLAALDYPAAKLDIVLVLEESDIATKLALLAVPLPGTMRVVVVPDTQPRTKPKALNYALHFARGDFVVVYDAEDRPQADQLRKAVAAFHDGPIDLACVQARLNVYNAGDSWFSKHFAIEYSALFDAILPALDRLRLPVPLGGTSNHFPRALLEGIGGWDPYNVTEDADLGIRLARLGYRVQVLDSTTWEEAPVSWSQWKPQRTRWLKGWYQTYLVHTRQPLRLARELGVWRTLGFHLFLGGIILSTLIHPWFYVVLGWQVFAPENLALPDVFSGSWIWLATGGTLVLGYASAILVGILAGWRRGHRYLLTAVQMPIFWLLVSYAGYRALWQLARDPFRWEKTEHGRAKSKTKIKQRV